MKKVVKIQSEHIMLIFLLGICFLLYFYKLGNYPFIDNDETKIVSIAKEMLNNSDWINIKLNGEHYIKTPPFLFWIINFFCVIFGKISTEIVRLPVAITSTIGIFSLFLTLKNILTKTYAFIITLIFASSLGIIIFSKLSTLDIVYSISTIIAILCSYKILFARTKTKIFLPWIGMFFFSALAYMSVGLFGLLIPFLCISGIFIFSGNIQKLIKPIPIFIGLIILAFIILPWNIIMVQKHGISFVSQYLMQYYIFDSTNFKDVFKSICYFIIGFMPWIFSFLFISTAKINEFLKIFFAFFQSNSKEKLNEKWNKLSKIDKFIGTNAFVFCIIFTFAIIFGAKHPYLINLLIFPASCITGFYWYEYITKNENDNHMFWATLIPNSIFILSSIIGVFGHNIINTLLTHSMYKLFIPVIIILFIIPIINIFSVILKGRIQLYITNILLMIFISYTLTTNFFNYITQSSGENDLIKYATDAHKKNIELAVFMDKKKYSIPYYYDNNVEFHNTNDFEWLRTYLKSNTEAIVITEIKKLWDIESNKINYILIDSNKKYCIIQHLEDDIKKEEKEPEIINHDLIKEI